MWNAKEKHRDALCRRLNADRIQRDPTLAFVSFQELTLSSTTGRIHDRQTTRQIRAIGFGKRYELR